MQFIINSKYLLLIYNNSIFYEVINLFGYIKPDKDELKLKDIKKYKKLHRFANRLLIKNFGLLSMKKADEAVFLLLLFNGLKVEKDYKNSDVELSEKAVNYTLLVVAFCIYERLKNESNIFSKITLWLFAKNRKRKRLFTENEKLIEVLENKLEEYYSLKETDFNFDELSDKIGELYAEMFKAYLTVDLNNSMYKSMYKLGFCVGKWLYMVSALNGLNGDIENNRVNPILYWEKGVNIEGISKRVVLLSNCIIERILLQLDNLQLNYNADIVYNIIRDGMPLTVQNIVADITKAIDKN